ncbi:MAG TPA: LPS export ABC transporter ATP-binding protein [Gemmatimonadales bacterium]|nr:LPS export ABC transporter ATP-binding protein [Gemmatimonadales bacterium]
MTAPLFDRLHGRDASSPLALAAFLKVADGGQPVRFGDLAVAYREAFLDLQDRVAHEGTRQSGTLSMDEVRGYLAVSVIPRLVTDRLLEPPSALDDDQAVLHAGPALAPMVGVPGVRERLVELAEEALTAAESVARPVPPSGSTLSARGLTKVYRRRTVVNHVDLELHQGEIVGLLGPNGAGKTTTFYMMVGLVRPDDGRIFIDDTDLSGLPMYQRARRGIGYLAQEPSVFRRLTVEENVLAILEGLKISKAERDARLEGLLDELAIKHLRKVPAYKLSGGERRRLEITRALVTEPKFMLLDEPFAGVDPIAVSDIQSIVASLRGRGIGVLITDHNVEQTFDIVDRAYIVFEGRVQVAGSVRELVFNDQVADLYLGPTLTARLRERLEAAA